MGSVEIIREFFGRGKSSTIDVSRQMGRSDGFLANYISTKRVPNADLFAEILGALGYDLIARNRETGEEILVSPPSK